MQLYQDENAELSGSVWAKLEAALKQADNNYELLNEMLTIPSVETLTQGIEHSEPLRLSAARSAFIVQMQENLHDFLHGILANIADEAYKYTKVQVNKRRVLSAVLQLLSYSQATDIASRLEKRFMSADNMTDKLNMLKASQICSVALFEKLMLSFEDEYLENAVVMDKWFALHATTKSTDILAKLTLLASHRQFNLRNPNKVRSLVGSFAFYNTDGFHALDGSGYQFLTDYLIELDAINPQIASRLVTPLIQYKKFAKHHQEMMVMQLKRLLGRANLSKDLYEKVSKSLSSQ